VTIKKIGISTGGGDAPGLNAVIRAVVIACLNRGWQCVGIRDGYNGLLTPKKYKDGGLISLDRESVRGITHLGGTILDTNNRDNPLRFPTLDSEGRFTRVDLTNEVAATAVERGLDALIAVGGDGSMICLAQLLLSVLTRRFHLLPNVLIDCIRPLKLIRELWSSK
jgi:6-phosphofructokinase 1